MATPTACLTVMTSHSPHTPSFCPNTFLMRGGGGVYMNVLQPDDGQLLSTRSVKAQPYAWDRPVKKLEIFEKSRKLMVQCCWSNTPVELRGLIWGGVDKGCLESQ